MRTSRVLQGTLGNAVSGLALKNSKSRLKWVGPATCPAGRVLRRVEFFLSVPLSLLPCSPEQLKLFRDHRGIPLDFWGAYNWDLR